jgi:hypothetical protein
VLDSKFRGCEFDTARQIHPMPNPKAADSEQAVQLMNYPRAIPLFVGQRHRVAITRHAEAMAMGVTPKF